VDDGGDRGKRHAGGIQRLQHAEGLVLDRGRHLGDAQRAAGGIHQDEIGEGAADIDADDDARARRGALASRRRFNREAGRRGGRLLRRASRANLSFSPSPAMRSIACSSLRERPRLPVHFRFHDKNPIQTWR
jgi:hypothetical protein